MNSDKIISPKKKRTRFTNRQGSRGFDPMIVPGCTPQRNTSLQLEQATRFSGAGMSKECQFDRNTGARTTNCDEIRTGGDPNTFSPTSDRFPLGSTVPDTPKELA